MRVASLLVLLLVSPSPGQQASGTYNCSALNELANASPTVPSCVGYQQYNLTQTYAVSVVSKIDYSTKWGPTDYNVAGSGVCIGLNSNWTSWNPVFIPNNSSGANGWVVTDNVISYTLVTLAGTKIPVVQAVNIASPQMSPGPPYTMCPCTSGTCQESGCTCGCGPIPPKPQQPCSCSGQTWVWNSSTCSWVCSGGSPILIDVDGSGFHLTDYNHGTMFDFSGTGYPVQLSWIATDSTNAWLALDRNGNGAIDSARELFGNITAQPQSADPNGFLALSVFDLNHDGVIDEKDPVYDQLLLWQAHNGGVSLPSELHTMREMGIKSISLDYRDITRKDKYGNWFHYGAGIDSRGAPWTYDVFLLFSGVNPDVPTCN